MGAWGRIFGGQKEGDHLRFTDGPYRPHRDLRSLNMFLSLILSWMLLCFHVLARMQ